MIIKNDATLRKEIQEIINTNAVNMNVADMLTTIFNYTDIINKDDIKQYIKEGWKENEAIVNVLFDFLGLDKDNDDNQEVMTNYVLNNLKHLNPNDYLNNPYVNGIKNVGKNNRYSLRFINYEPYQLFAYDDIKMKGYEEHSQIGYFDNKFSYLTLTEKNNVWMSLNPNEIETMKPYISKGKGDVLVLGLGMGYVPYMLARKQDVRSVLIIERDKDIINLFKSLIWPNFVNKNKIKIVEGDAIDYVSKNNNFDYIFADLWHDPEDGLPLFVSLKRINEDIDCWLETSMYALLRRCMITLIEETLNGSKEEDYKFAKIYTDKVINQYYQKTKNLPINSKEDLIALLSDENLLSLMTE